jgi:hypothetical protein
MDVMVQSYTASVERAMKRFFDSLSEKDRRRYAAVEGAKFGHGGLEYIACLFKCDSKTIQLGRDDLVELGIEIGVLPHSR